MSAISTKIYAKDSSGTLRELQPETTISNVSGLQTALDGKVNTVSGKGLSTNDYTTAEKNKLSGIEANANNYVHPTTSGNKHIPSGGSSGKILGWSSDGTAAWVDPTGGGGGDVSSVKVGSTTYNPDSSGVVSLPAYPTSLPANGGTAANVSGTVAVANGGTGATSASSARTNLGLGSAATKSTTTSVTSGSSALITSGAVYSKISPTSFSTVSAIGSYISNIEGGYARIGNLVVINIRCTVNTAIPSTWTTLISGFPYPVVKYETGSSGLALTNNQKADMALTGAGQIASSTAIAAGTTLLIDGVYITK